jgi:hypothetical protein
MNKSIMAVILFLMLSLSVMAANVQVGLVSGDIYSTPNIAPTASMKLTSGTVNVPGRTGLYAFQGELLHWDVLVADQNGKSDIATVMLGTASCSPGTQLSSGVSLSAYGVSGTFNTNNMVIYSCDYSVGTTHGSTSFQIIATDKGALTGTTRSDVWMLNPIVSVSVDTGLSFGPLSPGQQGAKTLKFTNSGEAPVILSVSADQNFYDPTPSGGMCPTSNALATQGDGTGFSTGFWYTTQSGSITTGNKRIPYGNTFAQSDPILSSSVSPSWKDTTTGNVNLAPSASMTATFHLGLPNPCSGHFTSGQIYLWGSIV